MEKSSSIAMLNGARASRRIPAANCRVLLGIARTAASVERSFALAGLADCAPAPEITEVLRNAVLLDDYQARARALESLGSHLRADLVPFLAALLHAGSRDRVTGQKERVLLYKYLERLANSNHRPALVSVFRRGLYGGSNRHARASVLEFLGRHGFLPERFAREKMILLASLKGLGKIRALTEWPRMEAFLSHDIKDPDVLMAALQGARLLPFPAGMAGKIAGDNRRLLFHEHAGVRGAAIRFFAGLPSIVATESLMIMYVKLNPADHRDLLEESIRARLRLDGTGGTAGIVLIRARLHDIPAERGVIAGVLDEYTVVYRDKIGSLSHRLRPYRGGGHEEKWHFVRTSSGLRGWLHAHRTLYPNLDIAVKKAPAAGRKPAASKAPAAGKAPAAKKKPGP